MIERLLPGAHIVSRPRLSTLTYAGEKKITRLPRRSAVVAFSADEVYAIAELIRRQISLAAGRTKVDAVGIGFAGIIREVHFGLDIVQRPGGQVTSLCLVPRVSSHRGVTFVDRIVSRVLNCTDKSSSAAHDESPVPGLRQQ